MREQCHAWLVQARGRRVTQELESHADRGVSLSLVHLPPGVRLLHVPQQWRGREACSSVCP